MLRRALLVAFVLAVVGCPMFHGRSYLDTHRDQGPARLRAPTSPPLAVLLADPQLHQLTGRALRSAGRGADRWVPTAIRPPTLNVLAPLVMRSMITHVREELPTAVPTLVLGDALNVACTGEWRTFEAVMNTTHPDSPWLMAHGNHDSFMVGNEHTWVPTTGSLLRLKKRPLPSTTLAWSTPDDFSLWSQGESLTLSQNANWTDAGWPGMCGSPQLDSAPMNKLTWLAFYLNHLSDLGASIPPTNTVSTESSTSSTHITFTPGTHLETLNFEGMLRVTWPTDDHTRMWASYLVQKIDISGQTTIIIIDTSVTDATDPTKLGGKIGLLNNRRGRTAGLNGRLGPQQISDIVTLAESSIRNNHRIIIAGHIPLERVIDASDLFSALEEKDLTDETIGYISAHNHGPFGRILNRVHNRSITEWNLGSTTDWPMEIATIHENNNHSIEWSITRLTDASNYNCSSGRATSSDAHVDVLSRTCPNIKVEGARGTARRSLQACIHAQAAKNVIRWLGGDSADLYEEASPSCSLSENQIASRHLTNYLAEIEIRASDQAQRTQLLCLASAVSRAHGMMDRGLFRTRVPQCN